MNENEEKIKAEVLESNDKVVVEEKIYEKKEELKIEDKKELKQEINSEKPKSDNEQYKFKQKLGKRKEKRSGKYIALTVIIVILSILGLLFSTIFALLNSNNNTILGGIYINDILVEGLTEEEAIKILNEKYENEKKREIPLKINGEFYSLTPEQIEVEYNIEKAVKHAHGIGKKGNIF